VDFWFRLDLNKRHWVRLLKCGYFRGKGKTIRPEYNAPFAIIAAANGSGAVTNGRPFGTVPRILFEKKGLIPALQQMMITRAKPAD